MNEYTVYINEKWVTEENCLNFDDWYEYEQSYGELHNDAHVWIQDSRFRGDERSIEEFVNEFNRGLIDYKKVNIYITDKY